MSSFNQLGKIVDVEEWVYGDVRGATVALAIIKGRVTSVRGMSGHANKHKYEITTEKCKHYRDTLKLKS